jgi:hypothetical protein
MISARLLAHRHMPKKNWAPWIYWNPLTSPPHHLAHTASYVPRDSLGGMMLLMTASNAALFAGPFPFLSLRRN